MILGLNETGNGLHSYLSIQTVFTTATSSNISLLLVIGDNIKRHQYLEEKNLSVLEGWTPNLELFECVYSGFPE